MKKISWALALLIMVTFAACSSDDGPASQNRNMKYELTGNYSGEITVIYSDEGGNQQIAETSSLPWSKSVTIDGDVPVVVLGVGNSVTNPGNEGETTVLKIYSGKRVVEESSVTAISDGYMNFSITYEFD
ncbi:hypothetical protein F8C76_01500 [Flagellimonas olearia]|uniref:Lipocalin-like domain-containing protein n=1 Tax=Flagellimonas olearia TaxID=552546 RepID=A0A6I1E2M8_9FLAO|nr:hypothetical protein [Allomuricauda olearia]KAB7530211.1 hypothetical protein F8C76_01500 [Allomuricauda olearia]